MARRTQTVQFAESANRRCHQRIVLPRYVNPNPRIGVLLDHNNASMRTKNVLCRFHMRGLNWLRKNWPEERMRRELRGYGPKTSREWNAIVNKRN